METPLTQTIKERLRHFRPQLNSSMRTIRWAEEVCTPTGYVDVVRFEDYVEKDESFCARLDESGPPLPYLRQEDMGKCKIPGQSFPCDHCRGCVHRRTRHVVGMLSTCFEVKITVADFKSENGHNFHGNRNYYAVPIEICPKIEPLVSPDIGIITYGSGGNMRLRRECVHRDVDAETTIALLYNAMKKWVDGAHETRRIG